MPCPASPCPALSCATMPCPALPYPTLPCPALPCRALPCLTLPCPTLPCPAQPCPALPCPVQPYPALPCPAVAFYTAAVYLLIAVTCTAWGQRLHCMLNSIWWRYRSPIYSNLDMSLLKHVWQDSWKQTDCPYDSTLPAQHGQLFHAALVSTDSSQVTHIQMCKRSLQTQGCADFHAPWYKWCCACTHQHTSPDNNNDCVVQVFINSSTSDVVATTSMEALAMGKWVICAHHPCNHFISAFANCLIYHNPHHFSEHLQYALLHQPAPLTQHETRCVWVLCCMVLYCIILYCIVLYCVVLYCIVLYCIVLYCIVLYYIVLYCTVLYCIVL